MKNNEKQTKEMYKAVDHLIHKSDYTLSEISRASGLTVAQLSRLRTGNRKLENSSWGSFAKLYAALDTLEKQKKQ